MPAFDGLLSSESRWALIDFLKAHNAGWSMRTTGRWSQPIVLPQFDALCPAGAAINLDDLRGRLVHIIAATGSTPPAAATAGPSVTTIVLSHDRKLKPTGDMCVTIGPATWDAFAILLGVSPDDLPGTQALADQNGWLRARWRPGDPDDWSDPQALTVAIRDIAAHPLAVADSGSHRHEAAPQSSETVETDPKRPENRPHRYTYKPSLHPEQDTVIASEESKSDLTSPEPAPIGMRQQPQGRGGESGQRCARIDEGTVMRMSPGELLVLAPRLRSFLKTPSPAWPEIVEAADWLRSELSVSKPLWSEACLAMGREQAAIAVAIVSAKPAEHFRSTPGGYFHGMVAKAKTGELNLERTVWGMRQAIAAKSQHPSRRQESFRHDQGADVGEGCRESSGAA